MRSTMQNSTEKAERKKKMLGAAISAVTTAGVLILLAVCMLLDYFGGTLVRGETVIIVLIALFFVGMAVAIAVVFFQRLREIERGEEDEAKKY